MNYLIYSVVPLRCVPPVEETDRQPDLLYACHGEDWLKLGIGAIAYCHGQVEDLLHYENAFREGVLVWDEAGMPAHLARLVRTAAVVVGFDAWERSDCLLQGNGVGITTHYDLWQEVIRAGGEGINPWAGGLQALAQANGLNPPEVTDLSELWQRGQQDEVKKHVLADVLSIHKLLVLGLRGNLKLPGSGRLLRLPSLAEVWAQRTC